MNDLQALGGVRMGPTGMMAHRYGRHPLLGSLVMSAVMLLVAAPAKAHRVTIFAWSEGDLVHTVSKFSGGKTVKNGRVTVYDLQGNLFLEGATDEQGNFSFTAPAKGALRIVLNTGAGHRAEWILEASDMDPKSPAETDSIGMPRERITQQQEEPVPQSGSAMSDLAVEEIQGAIERALDKKLQPVIEMITETRTEGPSVRDVVGGLGYIIGLVGMAAYLHSRWNRKGAPKP